MTRKLCFLLFLLVTCSAASAFGQANAVDAAVNGYVFDPSRNAIPHAHLTLTSMKTGISQNAESDGQGYYRFPLVPVGTYQLDTVADGFRHSTLQGIVLNVGQEARLDVPLELGATSQTVEVQAEANILDTGSSTVGTVLDQKEVENLPILSRQVYNFLLLSPGVIGMPTSTFSTTQFTFGGTERSQWNLDGLDDTQHGGNRQIRLIIVTPEAVAQTQTLANGYSAEFGRAAGGQINVVMKSGTNQFHGSAIGQWRATDIQAIPTLETEQPDRSWNDEAFTLGGPILKDRLFFFGQFENNPYTLPNAITITQANAEALGLPSDEIGTAPFGETYRTLVGKTDYKLGKRNSGYVRYARFTNHQPNTASGLAIVDRGARYTDHQNGGGAQLATILSDSMLNEFRVGVIQRDTEDTPVVSSSPAGDVLINISSVADIGFSDLTTTTTTERSTSVVDNLTWTHGRHTMKFGAEYDHELFANLSATAPTFTFSGLAAENGRGAVSALDQYLYTVAGDTDPATGNPYTYTNLTAYSGDPSIRMAFNFAYGFAQDEIRLRPNLNVNVGARYEVILFPTFDSLAPYPLSRSVPNDYSDIAPRFAFTWSPANNQKTVVHGAYGMFYDVPGLSTFYSAGQINGHRLLSYLVTGGTTGAPTFPNVPNLSGSGFEVKPSITAFAPNFHDAYQHQANLQVEQELPWNLHLTVGYMFAGLRHGLYYADTNLTPTGQHLADGRPTYEGTAKRPNTEFGAINLIHSGTSANFNGGFLTLNKRISNGLEFTVNYMYSHALNDNIGEGGSITDPSDLHRDYGNADADVRHNLVLQGLYQPTFKASPLHWMNQFELSTISYLNSGFPINVTAGTDLNNDGVVNDRPLFESRNSYRGRGFSQISMQVKRYFNIGEYVKASAYFGAENLFNSNNLSCNTTTGCTGAVVSTANSSDLFRETAAGTSRNAQVGFSVKF
ncbi:TonB-dependent receptor [Silvibacterium dinghuense]|uniref:TonB-dependent receptor n=1 Tax=Silvibacterium dinghuense TaxID=1560006 RepID=A0A4Q1SGU2_9BACT|nr:carboxypeptidase regulatory-like domain-containing protein [Silvibacterium dinghuense]RXS96567.1 TonB-dependent receptor [Silvibacterium dinghuense]GGG91837.1 membrane protein [Silvibacterium dinghuense]